ncbi:quinone oxidoreductase family protein [Deminuibacter soli]|uniref:NADP-dependent oxidoreductase n=1 Tax=Deminuibacter soli TaxID=2291815 RepID=A0A3E1NML3_9BACT|nr:NADP-dependent oxidoreductase [Deminuibacter soli]RFM29074.1 NADP-dependent oxidoreductase [Deminuibacter soli]
MKAVVLQDFGSTDNFVLQHDFPAPVNGSHDVIVQIRAAAFNPIDYQMRQGKTERKRMRSFVLGREFAGVVVKTGRLVTNFRKGDAVFAASGSMGSNGAYAEYISVPDNIIALKPAGLTFEQAAAVPVAFITALQCYNRLSLQPGKSIFVSGAAGGVGLPLIKLLLSKGFTQLTVTAGNCASRQQLLQAGLQEHQIINYKLSHAAEALVAANNGRLFDYCIDLVGGAMAETSAQVLAVNGSYADVTALTTPAAREQLFNKGAAIFNISNYAYTLNNDTDYYRRSLEEIARLLENDTITPSPVEIIGELSVETVRKAHAMLENNLAQGKKLVMQVQNNQAFSFTSRI